MFYKVRKRSAKTGLGKVFIIFRDVQGQEHSRFTGVDVHPDHFNTKTGKISPKDLAYPEKNKLVGKWANVFELAQRDMKKSGVNNGPAQLFATFVDTVLTRMGMMKRALERVEEIAVDHLSELRNDIAELKTLLAAKEAELREMEEGMEVQPTGAQFLFSQKLKEFQRVLQMGFKKPGTVKNYGVLNTMVTNFRPRLCIQDINLDFLNEFQQHLIDRGIRDNTIRETFVKFRGFYRWVAEDLGLDVAFLTKFKVVKETQSDNVVVLTPEEVDALEALPIKTKGMHRTRELLLFAIETGLRYSDWLVERANVQTTVIQDETGQKTEAKVLTLKTQKNDKRITVPLTRKALDILERNQYEFSRPSEAQFNQALRTMAKKVPMLHDEIVRTHRVGREPVTVTMPKWKALSSHVARKTFIHNAIGRGVSLMTVAEWVGHADTKMIEVHYAHKSENARRESYKILHG